MSSEGCTEEYDVFISYRRVQPDMAWVHDELYPALKQAGLKPCLDVFDFTPGRNVVLEITRATNTSRRTLCIISPDYFDGNRVSIYESQAAWGTDPAGTDSKLVPLVLRDTKVPEPMVHLNWVDWTDPKASDREWEKLLKLLGAPRQSRAPRTLPPPVPAAEADVDSNSASRPFPQAGPGPKTRQYPAPIGIPNLPPGCVMRDQEVGLVRDRLRALYLDERHAHNSRLIAIVGMSGSGKSVVASQVAHDSEILELFDGQVLWADVGKSPSVETILRTLLIRTDPSNSYETLSKESLRELLRTRLAGKRALLILDNVWEGADVEALSVLGSDGVTLITTQISSIRADLDATLIPIDLLPESTALQLLRSRAGVPDGAELPEEAQKIVDRCGGLPLALAIVGAMIRHNARANRWTTVLDKLQHGHLDQIRLPANRRLDEAISASLDELEPNDRNDYHLLCVFAGLSRFREAALETLWHHRAHGDSGAADLIDELVDRHLLTRVDDRHLALHDLLQSYVKGRTPDEARAHAHLLDGYLSRHGSWGAVRDDGYMPGAIAKHHALAGRGAGLVEAVREVAFGSNARIPFEIVRLLRDAEPESLVALAQHRLARGATEDPAVCVWALKLLSSRMDVQSQARQLLLETNDENVCMCALRAISDREEARAHARRLLLESPGPNLSAACLKVLDAAEAAESALAILQAPDLNPNLAAECLRRLDPERARDAARRLATTHNSYLLSACLRWLPPEEALEEAKRRLAHAPSAAILVACLRSLDQTHAAKYAQELLEETDDDTLRKECTAILLRRDARERALEVVRSSEIRANMASEIRADRLALGAASEAEGAERAKQLLDRWLATRDAGGPSLPDLVGSCLSLCDPETGAEYAERVIVGSDVPQVVVPCLRALGERGREQAQRLLTETSSAQIQVACLRLLREDAREAAHRLTASSDPEVRRWCLRILGSEAKEVARAALSEAPMRLARNKWGLYVDALKSSIRDIGQAERAHEILRNWKSCGRPLVAAALNVLRTEPSKTQRTCQDILNKWSRDGDAQRPPYHWHIIQALAHPALNELAMSASRTFLAGHEESYSVLLAAARLATKRQWRRLSALSRGALDSGTDPPRAA